MDRKGFFPLVGHGVEWTSPEKQNETVTLKQLPNLGFGQEVGAQFLWLSFSSDCK